MSGPLDFSDDDAPSGPEGRAPAERASQAPPPPAPPPPARPAGASRYSWFLGVVVLLLLAVVLLNNARTDNVATGGPRPGETLPPFAVPLATNPTDRVANVLEEAQGEFPAACDVRAPGALNACALARRGPLVLAIFPNVSGNSCREVLDQFERVAPQVEGVQFAAVGVRGDRDALTTRRWSFPVGWDEQAAVGARYGIVDCPQVTFAERGGRVRESVTGLLSDPDLARRSRALAPAR